MSVAYARAQAMLSASASVRAQIPSALALTRLPLVEGHRVGRDARRSPADEFYEDGSEPAAGRCSTRSAEISISSSGKQRRKCPFQSWRSPKGRRSLAACISA